MQKRRLGNTDLEITPIGFGAWAIGGDEWAFGWGPQDDRDSVAAIQRAVELGVNWIDTAAVYGFGHSEEIVASAIAQIPIESRPYVFTKCGLLPGKNGAPVHSLAPESIRREVDDSLRRLRVDTIDLYQIHWPSMPRQNADAEALEAAWRCLAEIRESGKVRHIGVCNFGCSLLRDLLTYAQVAPAVLQVELHPYLTQER